MATSAIMSGLMPTRRPYRATFPTVVSAALHAAVLIGLATTSIRIATENRDVIPLVIRQPAPPPPPPGSGTAVVASAPVIAPPVPRPIEPASQIKPAKVKPLEPKPIEKPKIAAKPKPKAKPSPQPAVEAAPASAPAAVPMPAAPTDKRADPAGGVAGGVAGGQIGGVVGGRRGGRGDDVWRADEVAVPPRLIESVRPSYPSIARARGQEAVVVVQAVIDRGGSVESSGLEVVESKPPFDDAALAAFRRWKFQPGRDDSGQLVRVLVRQPIRFQLR
jgi:protein TonB